MNILIKILFPIQNASDAVGSNTLTRDKPKPISLPDHMNFNDFPMEFQLFLNAIEPELVFDFKTNNGTWEYYTIHNIKKSTYEYEISPLEGKFDYKSSLHKEKGKTINVMYY